MLELQWILLTCVSQAYTCLDKHGKFLHICTFQSAGGPLNSFQPSPANSSGITCIILQHLTWICVLRKPQCELKIVHMALYLHFVALALRKVTNHENGKH